MVTVNIGAAAETKFEAYFPLFEVQIREHSNWSSNSIDTASFMSHNFEILVKLLMELVNKKY